jgi:cell division protein FtsB
MLTREEHGRAHHSLRRKAFTLFSVLALIALVVGSLFGDKGLLHVMEQQRRTHDLERQLEALRAENARLYTDILALRSDERAIERLAREQLGLARPGETVFLLRESGPAEAR